MLFQKSIELLEAQNFGEVFSVVASVNMLAMLQGNPSIMKQFDTSLCQYLLELRLWRQNVLSEKEAPYAEKEVFDDYMPVDLCHIYLKLFFLFVRHYAQYAVRVARVI